MTPAELAELWDAQAWSCHARGRAEQAAIWWECVRGLKDLTPTPKEEKK